MCAKIIRIVFGVLHHGTAYDPQIDNALGDCKKRIHAYSNRCLNKVSDDAKYKSITIPTIPTVQKTWQL